MKVFTLLPHSPQEQEVFLDHFYQSFGRRYAVVYTVNDHGEPMQHVRLVEQLRFEETAADAA